MVCTGLDEGKEGPDTRRDGLRLSWAEGKMYLGELEKSMMSRLGGQAGHPWGPSLGRADQLNQAPWEKFGAGAREHPQHPARGGRWSSWERELWVLFAGQTWKVPTPCLTWNFSAWASGSGPYALATPRTLLIPTPSPHIDSLRAVLSSPLILPLLSLSHLLSFLTTRKMTLLYFLTSTNASLALCTMPAFCLLSRFSLYPLVFPFYDGPGSGFLRIYPCLACAEILEWSNVSFIEFGIYLLQVSNFLLHCSLFFGNSNQTYVRYFEVSDIWSSILFAFSFLFLRLNKL